MMEYCDENMTSEVAEFYYKYPTVSWSVTLIFVPLVSAFGIFNNFCFMFVVYRVKTMRNVTNIFLINLAVADCMLLIAACLQYIVSFANSPHYEFGSSAFWSGFGCMFPDFVIYLCYYTSLWTVTLVSTERYIAVCHPIWHRSLNGKQRAKRLVIGAWVVSLLFSSLLIPFWKTHIVCVISSDDGTIHHRVPECYRTCDWCYKALYSTDLMQFITTLIVNFILYALIISRLTKSSFTNVDELQKRKSQKRTIDTRNSVARMLIINGVVFFVCLTPFSIYNIDYLVAVTSHTDLLDYDAAWALGWVARVMFLLNSAVNPIIYTAVNARYREAFKKSFHFQRKYNTVSNITSAESRVTTRLEHNTAMSATALTAELPVTTMEASTQTTFV